MASHVLGRGLFWILGRQRLKDCRGKRTFNTTLIQRTGLSVPTGHRIQKRTFNTTLIQRTGPSVPTGHRIQKISRSNGNTAGPGLASPASSSGSGRGGASWEAVQLGLLWLGLVGWGWFLFGAKGFLFRAKGFLFGALPFRNETDISRIVEVVERSDPAVVVVFSKTTEGEGWCSGFIVSSDGLVATCAHGLNEKPRVQLADGRTYDATVRDVDREADVATLKIDAERPLPALAVRRSADDQRGEFVIAIGTPCIYHTVASGVLVQVRVTGEELGLANNSITDYIDYTAPSEPGCSGRPLINMDGEVIGMGTGSYDYSLGSYFWKGKGSIAVSSRHLRHLLDKEDKKVDQKILK